MYYKSKKTSLIILALTAIVTSRMFFVFLNDPEGGNLLVTTVAALLVYGVSLMFYMNSRVKQEGFNRLLLAVIVQVIIVAIACVVL
jgi:hypothetical protein